MQQALDRDRAPGWGLRAVLPLVAILSLATQVAAQGTTTERLTGEALFGGVTLIDPPPGEPAGTHVYFTVTGAAARRMFNAMPGPVRNDACEPGWRTKRAGHVRCSLGRRAADAQCSFAVVLTRGDMAQGGPC